jgi:hypothetical protein
MMVFGWGRRPQPPTEWELSGTAEPWGVPDGWAPGTSAPTIAEPAPCDVCGEHPDTEACPFRQAAGTILDAAAGGWLTDHPSGACRTGNPNCRGECNG